MQIPPSLRSLFELFPLIKYEDEAHTPFQIHEKLMLSNRDGSSCEQQCFDLFVHQVRPLCLDEGLTKYTPTDPAGLLECLLACHKHHLVLPNDANKKESGVGLLSLSYLASPTKELPMSLSVTKERITSRSISLHGYEYSKCGSFQIFVADFLDTLNDLWILSLLAMISRVNPGILGCLFTVDEELNSKNLLSKLVFSRLSHDIESWHRFAQRNPNLFTISGVKFGSAQMWSPLLTQKEKALEMEYFQRLTEFQHFVPLFLSYLKESEKSEFKSLCELKFASFVICAEYFLPSNLCLSSVCEGSMHDALKFSKQVLSSF